MSRFEYIKFKLVDLIENRMKPFDKALLLIPDNKLDFKPVDEAMTICDLGVHVYQCIFVIAGAVKNGDFTQEDYKSIPFDTENIQSAKELVVYGKKTKSYLLEVLEDLKEEDLDREISFSCWGGFKEKIGNSLETILEEVFHHRGQLCVYLRMLGINPPQIYDYS